MGDDVFETRLVPAAVHEALLAVERAARLVCDRAVYDTVDGIESNSLIVVSSYVPPGSIGALRLALNALDESVAGLTGRDS